RFISPKRLARIVRQDFGHNPERRQNQHVNFGMPEEPEQMLPQKRVPPPLIDTGAPFTTRPLGRKKLVCATRSINCMTIAASSGGNASSNRKAVTNCAHTKNGSRIHVSPLARNCMIVVMKLIAPSNDEEMR